MTYLEDSVELGGEHHVALGLELASHESLLAVDLMYEPECQRLAAKGGTGTAHLALGEVDEDLVGEDDGDIGLGLSLALVDGAGLLSVDSPGCDLLCVVGDFELEDTVGL